MRSLHDATWNDDLRTVMALLKDNPDRVFSTDNYSWAALHYAAHNG